MPEFITWNGGYRKMFYLALIDGVEVSCWPNAGEMCATDGTGRSWKPSDNIQVRPCTQEEWLATNKEISHE